MRAYFAVIAIVAIVGCGGGRAAGDTSPPKTVSADCVKALSGLTDALTDLDSRLSLGMNFSAYSDKLAGAKVEYDRADFKSLDADCIYGLGKPDEDAYNEFGRAYNVWNDCLKKTGCTTDSIETELQTHWTNASTILREAKARMP